MEKFTPHLYLNVVIQKRGNSIARLVLLRLKDQRGKRCKRLDLETLQVSVSSGNEKVQLNYENSKGSKVKQKGVVF